MLEKLNFGVREGRPVAKASLMVSFHIKLMSKPANRAVWGFVWKMGQVSIPETHLISSSEFRRVTQKSG